MNLLRVLKTSVAAVLNEAKQHMNKFIEYLIDPPVPKYIASKEFLGELHLRRALALRFYRHFLATVLVVILAIPALFLNHIISWQTTIIGAIPPTVTAFEPASQSGEGNIVETTENWVSSDGGGMRLAEKNIVSEKNANTPAAGASIQTITSYSVRVWALWLQSITLLVLVGGILWAVVALCRIE